MSRQIAEGDEPRAARWRPWVLVPVASACVVMLAVFVARENSGKVRLKPDTTSDATPVASPRATSETPPVETPSVASGFSRTSPAAVRTPRVGLPQLPPTTVEPIEVDRMEVAPLALSRIEINPIGIDRIEISAMP